MEEVNNLPELTPWWGTFSMDAKTGGRWDIGPSTLWLYRTHREWRVFSRLSADPTVVADPMTNRSAVDLPIEADEMTDVLESVDEGTHVTRHAFGKTKPEVILRPVLADRPVVSRPEQTMHIPAGESVTLYLSTALRIQIVLPDPERVLQELPTYQLSDTWFGTTTTKGEFCYASRTSGRLDLDLLPRRLHRALTPLHVENGGSDALILERVQLPVRHLSLFETPQKTLWTETVKMIRKAGSDGADIQIRRGPPADAAQATLLQPPRDDGKRGLFTTTFGAFGALFSS